MKKLYKVHRVFIPDNSELAIVTIRNEHKVSTPFGDTTHTTTFRLPPMDKDSAPEEGVEHEMDVEATFNIEEREYANTETGEMFTVKCLVPKAS